MKKILLTVFFLGIITVIAGVPIFTKVVVPDMLEPCPPVTGLPLELEEFPIPERSVVAVKLELPAPALAEKANQYIPGELKGVKHRNFHEKVTNGVVNWKMWPGSVTIRNTGRDLSFALPIRSEAQATGGYGLGIFRIQVSGNSKMSGSVQGRIAPLISPDWQVKIPRLNPVVSIQQAKIKMAGMEISNAREKIRDCLTPMIQSESAKIAPFLTEALHLKQGVKKLWDQAHVSRLLRADPLTWVVFDPNLVQMSPIDYSNPSLFSLTVGLVAESLVTNAEPLNRLPEALPNLLLKQNNPVTDIRIPIIVNFRTLNHTLKNRDFSVETRLGATVGVSSLTVEQGLPGYLNLGMDVSIPAGKMGRELSARIGVHAKPVVDCVKQVLGFTNVSLAVETTKPLTGALAWMMDEMLVETIARELRIDVKEFIPSIEKEIQKVITAVPVPDHFDLKFDEPKVNLIKAYTVKQNSRDEGFSPGIVFVMGAKGNIKVRIKQL